MCSNVKKNHLEEIFISTILSVPVHYTVCITGPTQWDLNRGLWRGMRVRQQGC